MSKHKREHDKMSSTMRSNENSCRCSSQRLSNTERISMGGVMGKTSSTVGRIDNYNKNK